MLDVSFAFLFFGLPTFVQAERGKWRGERCVTWHASTGNVGNVTRAVYYLPEPVSLVRFRSRSFLIDVVVFEWRSRLASRVAMGRMV